MKEIRDSNYVIEITPAEGALGPEIGDLLPNSYHISINHHVVDIVLIPWLPVAPWPPPFPDYSENWKNRDEAAWHVFGTEPVTIAPSDEDEVRRQTVTFDELPETAHTVFRVPREQYSALIEDIRLYFQDGHTGFGWRLDDLGTRPLAEFLRNELPRAVLRPLQRETLCLSLD